MTVRAVFAGVVLLAAGCAKGASPPPATPTHLVIGLPAGLQSISPNLFRDEFATTVLRNVFEPLVELDGDLGIQPGLAESWHSPDDVTWRFRLRPEVRLHDGRLLDATLVKLSVESMQASPGSRKGALLSAVEAVEVIDPATIAFRTRQPFGLLANRLASVLIDVPGPGPADPPVGTGPYRIRTWKPGGDILLEAFDGYRQGTAAIRSVEFRILPDGRDRAAGLRRGELDLVSDPPAEEMAALGATPGVRTLGQRGLRLLFLGMDCARPANAEGPGGRNPFRDRRVREAVARAVDRPALVREALGGDADVLDQLVTPEILGFHRDLEPIPFDPEAARALLAEAGYTKGFEVPLDYIEGRYRAMEAVVAAVAADLGRVGIRVRPRASALRATQERIEDRDPPLLGVRGWLDPYNEAVATYQYLVHSPGASHGLANSSLYASAEVDRLLGRAVTEGRPERRRLLLNEVAQHVRADLPVVPLYRQRDVYALDAGLEFHPRLDRRLRLEQMRWASPRRGVPEGSLLSPRPSP